MRAYKFLGRIHFLLRALCEVCAAHTSQHVDSRRNETVLIDAFVATTMMAMAIMADAGDNRSQNKRLEEASEMAKNTENRSQHSVKLSNNGLQFKCIYIFSNTSTHIRRVF